MATYIILSKLSPDALKDPKDFKELAATVAQKIRAECPGVSWKGQLCHPLGDLTRWISSKPAT